MKAIRLFLKHYALKSTRWRKFKYSIKYLIERKVFSSTKNKNEWNIQKHDTILLVVTIVLLSTKEEKYIDFTNTKNSKLDSFITASHKSETLISGGFVHPPLIISSHQSGFYGTRPHLTSLLPLNFEVEVLLPGK